MKSALKILRTKKTPALWGMLGCLLLVPVISFASGQELTVNRPASDLKRAELKRAALIRQTSRANVCVFSTDEKGGGSGVLIDPRGLALSNYHVVDPCGPGMICGLDDGRVYDAVLVGMDPVGDLALIKLLGRDDFPVAEFGDSAGLRVGENCFALGNPFLLAHDFSPTVTWGIISGLNRYQYPSGTLLEYPDCIQTDAAINPGNSGGPLFDSRGKLIGINGRGSFEKRGRVNVGVGYAISIQQVRNFLGTLKSGRILDHAGLGFVVSTARDGTVRISEISSKSDAYRQGLRYDSRILAVGGRRLTTVNDLKNIVGTFPEHWRIPVVFESDGKSQEVMVRLQGVHSTEDLLKKINPSPASPENLSQAVKERYRAGRGYANRFFNDLETERLKQESRRSPEGGIASRILWKGQARLDPFTLVCGEGQSGIRIGEESSTLEGDLPFENQTLPSRSGGMLNLLHLHHRVCYGKSEGLGMTFIGTAPFVFLGEKSPSKNWVRRQQMDVLKVLRDGTETLFYINSQKRIVAGEYFSFPGAEPCVVEFHGEKQSGEWTYPARILALRGGQVFADLRVESFDVGRTEPREEQCVGDRGEER